MLEVTASSVDRQGVVSLSVFSYVGGHGVLTETLVSSVDRHGVVSSLVTVTELTVG